MEQLGKFSEVVDVDDVALAKQGHRAHHVLQLANVPRPAIAPQHLAGGRGDAPRRAAELAPCFVEKSGHQQGNILGSIAQGRYFDDDAFEPIVEIFSKRSQTHHLFEIAVGRADDHGVSVNGLRAADPLELPLLQHSQQRHLGFLADVADLVEKDGS